MPITSEAKDGFGSQNRYNNQQFGGNENIGISEENMALPRDNIVFTGMNLIYFEFYNNTTRTKFRFHDY